MFTNSGRYNTAQLNERSQKSSPKFAGLRIVGIFKYVTVMPFVHTYTDLAR